MTSAMALPEILFVVAVFLRRHDLTVCSRVSRDWNAVFGPLVWQDLTICTSASLPKRTDLSALFYHAGSIIRLESNDVEKPYLKDLFCRNLRRLTLRGYLSGQSLAVLRHKHTLTHLVLGIIQCHIPVDVKMSEVMWEAIASCESLQSLIITKALVTLTSWSTCWSLCSRLHKLQLQEIDFWEPNDDNDNISLSMWFMALEEDNGGTPVYSTLKELKLRSPKLSVEDQLTFLKVSPNLETFKWSPGYPLDLQRTGKRLMEQARLCPRLIHLDLDLNTDALLSFLEARGAIMTNHRPLEGLKLPRMTDAIWRVIQVHFVSSLRFLDLSAHHAGGETILSMLTSLSNLESFSGKTICGTDILNIQPDASGPWVCLGLVHLSLGCAIEHTFSREVSCAIQAEIFERIGSLTRLKTLYMFSHDGLRATGNHGFLNFGLASGLNCLKDLQQLEIVDFSHTRQQLSEREVLWMLSNWPRLALLPGKLHHHVAVNRSLRTLLNQHGVLQESQPDYGTYFC